MARGVLASRQPSVRTRCSTFMPTSSIRREKLAREGRSRMACGIGGTGQADATDAARHGSAPPPSRALRCGPPPL